MTTALQLHNDDQDLTAAPAPAPAAAFGPAPAAPLPLASRDVITEAPMSFSGSLKRIARTQRRIEANLTDVQPALAVAARVLLTLTSVALVFAVWGVIFFWYVAFGLLLVPYRLIRRSQRKEKLARAQHAELMTAMQAQAAIAGRDGAGTR